MVPKEKKNDQRRSYSHGAPYYEKCHLWWEGIERKTSREIGQVGDVQRGMQTNSIIIRLKENLGLSLKKNIFKILQVFVPTSLNVLSILMFLRFGFILGQAGIMGMMGMFFYFFFFFFFFFMVWGHAWSPHSAYRFKNVLTILFDFYRHAYCKVPI